MGMDFPVTDLMDENACYASLESVLHPAGLACPDCGAACKAASPAGVSPAAGN